MFKLLGSTLRHTMMMYVTTIPLQVFANFIIVDVIIKQQMLYTAVQSLNTLQNIISTWLRQ